MRRKYNERHLNNLGIKRNHTHLSNENNAIRPLLHGQTIEIKFSEFFSDKKCHFIYNAPLFLSRVMHFCMFYKSKEGVREIRFEPV